MRRNNDELVANWGNLVNRTLTIAHKQLRRGARAGRADGRRPRGARRESTAGFETVGDLIERRASGPRSPRRCGWRRSSTSTSDDQAPWALVKTDRERAGTVLYVALRAIDSLKTLLHAVPAVQLAGGCTSCSATTGGIAGPLELRDGRRGRRSTHEVLTGDYASVGRELGSRASSPRARSCASRGRCSRSSIRSASSRTSSRGWGPRRSAVIDTHAHLDALRRPADGADRAGTRRPASTRIVTVGHRHRVVPRGARARRARTTGSSPRSASTRTRPATAEATPRRRAARAARAPERAVAVGETGLDYFRDCAPRDGSAGLFEAQLELAAELGKPVVIHTRDADADTAAVLAGLRRHRRPALLLVAGPAASRRSNAAGTSRSPATSRTRRPPICATPRRRSRPSGSSPRRTARTSRRRPRRGRPNEPANVVLTLAALAEARGEDAGRARRADRRERRALRSASREASGRTQEASSASTSSSTRTSSA